MKKIIIFFLLLSTQTYAQNILKGKIIDANTNKALAFANVFFNTGNGVVSDFDGNFELKNSNNYSYFYITYIGYVKQKIKIDKNVSSYTVKLIASNERLQEVVISSKYVNPAIKLLKKIIKEKNHNDYRKKLIKYSFSKYYRFLVTADTTPIKQLFDSIYKGNKLIGVDSSAYKFKKYLANKDIFLMENITSVNGKNNKEKNNILATRISGFKNPLYEMLALQVSGQNVYDDHYDFLFNKYLGPFTTSSLKHYQYEIDDTIQFQNRKIIVLSYQKNEKPLISGQVYIDYNSLAIAKLTLNSYKFIELKTTHNFTYYPKYDVWFPSSSIMKIKKTEKNKDIVIDNEGINFQAIHKENDSIRHTAKTNTDDLMYAVSKTIISEVNLENNNKYLSLYSLQIDPKAVSRSEKYWSRYKNKNLRDLNTYQYIDSIFVAEDVEKKINIFRTVITGYIPYKFIDINVLHAFDYNLYEGIRLQLGGKTNNKISDKFFVNAYVAYGFKDKDFKYKTGANLKLSHKRQTYLYASYFKDLQKSGAFTQINTGLMDLPNRFTYDKFFQSKGFEIGIKHLLSEKLAIDLRFQKVNNEIKHQIPYHPGRIEFAQTDISAVNINMEWTPFSKYFLAPQGRKIMKDAYPKMYVNFEKNIPSWQTNNRNYYRFDFQTYFKKKYLNNNYTDFVIRIGYASKGSSLHQLYTPNSNDIFEQTVLNRFNVHKKFGFETMKDFEFADNIVSSLYLQHTFTGIKLSKKNKFNLRILAKTAIGLSYDENKYEGIKSLKNIYYETGIEFNGLVKNMGLGFYYRLGDYAYKNNWENLAVRLTLTPFKLFGK